MVDLNDLVTLWSHLNNDTVFPEDKSVLEDPIFSKEGLISHNLDEIKQKEILWNLDDHSLHLDLRPVPYAGDLARAQIFVLMLNPGLSYGDYECEKNLDFKALYQKNLQQEKLENLEYPFVYLDPKLSAYPCFNYWVTFFHNLIFAVQIDLGSWKKAAKKVASKLAVLELIPYHSRKGPDNALKKALWNLPSSSPRIITQYVNSIKSNPNNIILVTKANYYSDKDIPAWQIIAKPPKIFAQKKEDKKSYGLGLGIKAEHTQAIIAKILKS